MHRDTKFGVDASCGCAGPGGFVKDYGAGPVRFAGLVDLVEIKPVSVWRRRASRRRRNRRGRLWQLLNATEPYVLGMDLHATGNWGNRSSL